MQPVHKNVSRLPLFCRICVDELQKVLYNILIKEYCVKRGDWFE